MTTTLTMKDLTIGTLVTVNDSTARNPGGYGRVTRRSPKHSLVHVDSGEFPGQEVTGWYPIENVELYTPATTTETTPPAGTYRKEICYDRETITPELTRQAEMLYYRLRNQGNRIWDAKRATRPGEEREQLGRQWRKTEHARERAYARVMRRRAVTGWTYQES